jgi:hypothetical protein
VLKGAVYPGGQQTSYYFQYGTSTAYGAQTPAQTVAGAQTVHILASLAGLSPGASYHYRLLVANASGAVIGSDRTFTTRKIPLLVRASTSKVRTLFESPLTITGTLSGTGSGAHPVQLEASPFPYLGGFKPVGAPQLTDAAGGFSFALAGLAQNTQLRVSTVDAPPVHSQIIPEHVAVRVALHVRATRRPGFARLYGTIVPAEVGAVVDIQLLRGHRAPLSVGVTLARRGSTGFARFARVVRLRRGGLYRVLVRTLGGSLEPNHSPALRIR